MKKKKKKESTIDFGSYSDLFMVMSFVFLFMYIISSINTGVAVIQERHKAQTDKKKLEATVANYERKIETDLSDEQKKEYAHLKSGLIKLKADAKDARKYQEKMARLALEKEKELEVYQETVDAMMLNQIKVAEEIKRKDHLIKEVKGKASETIKKQERAIASMKEDLKKNTSELEKRTSEVQKRTKEIAAIESRVTELKNKEAHAENQANELKTLTNTLKNKEQQLKEIQSKQENLQQEKNQLYKATVLQVNKLNREKAAITQNSQEELDRLKKEKDSLIDSSRAEIANLGQQKENEIQALKIQKEAELSGLKSRYLKATEGLRKEIANSLARSLHNSGLPASVNQSTGDVTVHFKNAYYDYNSSVLNEEMKQELKAFIPLYAKSLFSNEKYASSLASLEIIGSASPSFKGKYINPRSMASIDEKNAMKYNMDLSYRRAKGIFEHTFLTNEISFDHKNEMIPLIKVSGTGYLQAMEELETLPEHQQDKSKGFCGVYKCELFQKVTLRFNLKDSVTNK